MNRTAFFTDERTFWHTGGTHALFFPVGGWVQPPSSAGYAESPDSKRRFLSLVQASGPAAQLDLRGAEPASTPDLLRIHPAHYLDAFRTLSDANGGDLGDLAPFGKGSYEIAALSAGLAIAAVDTVLGERAANAFAVAAARPSLLCAIARWASACWRTSRSRSRPPVRNTASSASR